MLPVKWKIFKILSYVQVSYTVSFFVYYIWLLVLRLTFGDTLIYEIITGVIAILIVIGPIFNIILIYKNFPDKAISSRQLVLLIMSIIANIVCAFLLLMVIIFGVSEEFSSENDSPNQIGKILLAFLFLITLVNLFVLILQFGMKRFLRRNNKATLVSLIDSIGENETSSS